jgi:GNAT superfamily N-acetyltransferase
MRAADAAEVARLSGELGYPARSEEIEERFARLAEDTAERVFVAHDGEDHVRGWLHVSAGFDLTGPVHAEVRGLVVDAQHRGRGIGRTLLEAAEAWAAVRGCRAMKVRSNTVRTQARAFYERAGYEVTKTQHHFRKPLPEPR